MSQVADQVKSEVEPAPTADIDRLLAANSRRWKTVILLEGLGLAVAAPLAYLWFIFYLDNRVYLPMAGRVAASLGFVGGLIWAGLHLARRWSELRFTEDQVALAIERRTPGKLGNRLINAVQLARTSASGPLLLKDAVVQENVDQLRKVRLEQAAQYRSAWIRVGSAGLIVLIGIGFWLFQTREFNNAAARIFLPLADIDPLYRTRLKVNPGDCERQGDVAVFVTIDGERPESLTVIKTQNGKRFIETIPVTGDDDTVSFVLRDVHQPLEYAVHGGDFTSPTYHIDIPGKSSFARMGITYQYPTYTGLSDKIVESVSGELEALYGTSVKATFFFDRGVENVLLIPERPTGSKNSIAPVTLEKVGPKEFRGVLILDDLTGYRLEIQRGNRPPPRAERFAVRVLRDQEPKLEIIGLERRMEVQIDSVLPLQLSATDDFGLKNMGLFYRRAPKATPVDAEKSAGAAPVLSENQGWQELASWPCDNKKVVKQSYELAIVRLQIAEGDKVEVAVRALDTDPSRNGVWTTGPIHELTVGGEGVALQLQYEQLVRSEAAIKALIEAQEATNKKVVAWVLKLDNSGDIRWDDPKNIDMLHAAVKDLRKEQGGTRLAASATAREMLPQTGNLRIGVGLLADVEIDRLLRIFDSVTSRDGPQAKRAVLAEARVTQERMVRSLQEISDQHAVFRSDWELGNMIPFTKMLADRQTRMRDQSRKLSEQTAGVHEDYSRKSMQRRQVKVDGLCTLIEPALAGLSVRLVDQEAILSKAFHDGAKVLGGDALHKPLREAAIDAKKGAWKDAAAQQTVAAEILTTLHAQLRQAQIEAAQKALAALKEKAKSDLEAQKELEKLPPGTAEAFVKNYPENFKVEDTVRIREILSGKKTGGNTEEPDFKNAPLIEVDRKQIELEKDSGVRQDPNILQLGKIPEKTGVLDMAKGKDGNKVQPFIQEKFDDLVGKLLDEADELYKDYQSIKLSTNQNNNDPGEIGKIGGKLNSTGAVAATGNKKPPTTESGGVSRTGRQGARAYGLVADDEAFDRKGRDKALDGQEQVADQPGKIKLNKTDEMGKDMSTGVGGKKVDTDDNHFSLHDTGKWKDEFTKRMEKPQAKNYIVERQGDRLDPKVAAMLRDLTGKQEQVIERLKAIKKELRNLYLPTGHLDDVAAALEINLESLKDRPEAELFRLQVQNLDKLRGMLRVFGNAGASFQPSLPRDRLIRGRILDDPAAQVLPGYEDAVRQYYLKLANQ